MPVKINFSQEAKQKLLQGVRIACDAVCTTLGPTGRNVAIDRGYERIILHDGVSVAKSIELEDRFENFGAQVLREAAEKTVSAVGDGTTATVLLARSIIDEAEQMISTGINPMLLRKGLEAGRDVLLKELTTIATPVNTIDQEIQIATISAEDKDLGELIGKTIHDVGPDGIVTVEESKSDVTFVEKQEGMQFDKGYISPYFITDPDRMDATIEDAYILLTDKIIDNVYEVMPFLEKVSTKTHNLVIIAQDVTGNALATFVNTKMKGGMNLLCVRAPLFGQPQKEFLNDIAILTGGTVVTEDAGMKFDSINIDVLGTAQRVTATKDATLIVGGVGNKENITKRVQALRGQLSRLESAFEKEKIRERLAKLSAGVAVIKVGGHTEIEMKERKERALDAVAAVQAAMKEGIVPGGEIIYLQIREKLKDSPAERILYRALEKPFCKLVENAGYNSGRMMERINDPKSYKALIGVDVTTGKLADMMKVGIIDPVLVPKNVITNAISVATQLITTDCVIVPLIEKKK